VLADVRVMRHDGRRLPLDRVRSIPARRGELRIARRRDPWRNEWVPVATLLQPDLSASALPALDQVRVMRWSGAELLLVGVEHVGRPKQARPSLQAWWVHLVTGPRQKRSHRGNSKERHSVIDRASQPCFVVVRFDHDNAALVLLILGEPWVGLACGS
jgi:hypothetical protein